MQETINAMFKSSREDRLLALKLTLLDGGSLFDLMLNSLEDTNGNEARYVVINADCLMQYKENYNRVGLEVVFYTNSAPENTRSPPTFITRFSASDDKKFEFIRSTNHKLPVILREFETFLLNQINDERDD